MAIYLGLFLLLIPYSRVQKYTFVVSGQKKGIEGKTVYALLIGITLMLLMGLRSEQVGCDLPFYVARFINSPSMIERGMADSEWGYTLINYIFKAKLNANFQVFLFFVSVLCIGAVVTIFYNHSKDLTISIIEYIAVGNFALNMSGLRQTVAISIALFAIIAVEKRKIVVFYIMIAIAFLMHNSAVIFIPVYFLWGRQLTKKQGVICLVVACAAFIYRLALNPLITLLAPAKYLNMNLDTNYEINFFVLLVPIVICIYSLVFMTVDDKGKFSEIDSFYFVFSCISILLMILSLNNNQLGRLSYYYNIGYAIILGSSMNAHRYKDPDSYKLIRILMIGLFVAYFFISEKGGTMHIDNYSFFWNI